MSEVKLEIDGELNEIIMHPASINNVIIDIEKLAVKGENTLILAAVLKRQKIVCQSNVLFAIGWKMHFLRNRIEIGSSKV